MASIVFCIFFFFSVLHSAFICKLGFVCIDCVLFLKLSDGAEVNQSRLQSGIKCIVYRMCLSWNVDKLMRRKDIEISHLKLQNTIVYSDAIVDVTTAATLPTSYSSTGKCLDSTNNKIYVVDYYSGIIYWVSVTGSSVTALSISGKFTSLLGVKLLTCLQAWL